jgi:hypothetical protein
VEESCWPSWDSVVRRQSPRSRRLLGSKSRIPRVLRILLDGSELQEGRRSTEALWTTRTLMLFVGLGYGAMHRRAGERKVRPHALGVALAIMLSISGCVGSEAPAVTTRTPQAATSGFASDDEALAAATEGYRRYLEVLDAVSTSGSDVDRLREVATSEYADEVIESVESLRADGFRIEGTSAFESMQVFERWSKRGVEFVSTYLCFDSSGVRVVDANGADVTPSDRIDRRSVLVRFQSTEGDPKRLVPRSSDTWPRDDFCG